MAFNKKAQTTRNGFFPRINPLFALEKDYYYYSKEFLRDEMINISPSQEILLVKLRKE